MKIGFIINIFKFFKIHLVCCIANKCLNYYNKNVEQVETANFVFLDDQRCFFFFIQIDFKRTKVTSFAFKEYIQVIRLAR